MLHTLALAWPGPFEMMLLAGLGLLIFGKRLPDNPVTQWRYGHKVRSKRHLRLGDLLFFKERGYSHPITHVGMYAGNGYILHASSYFGKVVKSKMKYINGYYGAKRVRPHR